MTPAESEALRIEIESVYDPLSHSSEGVITSQAPLIVYLHGWQVPPDKKFFLFLFPHGRNLERIFITTVYHFEHKVIVIIPNIAPGVYHPGVMTGGDDGELPKVNEFPSVSWTVLSGRPQ